MNTKVPFGPSSIVGYLGSIGWLVVGIIDALNSGALNTDSWYLFALSVASYIATNLGRQHQAAQAARATGTTAGYAADPADLKSHD